MTKGWFSLTFARPEHSDWALKQFWHLELHPVYLKRWVPLFDPKKENAGAGPIWMRLPGLPLHFWNDTALRNIGAILDAT